MKRIAIVIGMFAMTASAQSGVSFSGQATTVSHTSAPGQAAPILAVPFATIKVYALGTSTLSPLYADAGMTVPATNPYVTDGSGNFGFYTAAGQYTYTITSATGQAVGSGNFTSGGSGGTAVLSQSAIAAVGILLNDTSGTAANATSLNGGTIPVSASVVGTDASGRIVAASSGTTVALKTNGVTNTSQTALNLQQGAGITITNTAGTTTFTPDVQSINGQKGTPVLGYADVGADPAGAAAAVQVADQAFSSNASNLSSGLVPNPQLCNGTPGTNTYCDPVSRNWLVLPGSSSGAGVGTINSGTIYSPTYYTASGTTVGGVTPFNGPAVWSTTAVPRAAVQPDFNPFLTAPGPIGTTTPNLGRFAGDTTTGAYVQWFIVPATPGAGTGTQPGTTGMGAGYLCSGAWPVNGAGTFRAQADCWDTGGQLNHYVSNGVYAFGSEQWTTKQTIAASGQYTNPSFYIGQYYRATSGATPVANSAFMDFQTGTGGRIRADGTNSTTYAGMYIQSETGTGGVGATMGCLGAPVIGLCSSTVTFSAPQSRTPPETVAYSATPTFSATTEQTYMLLTGNVTSVTIASPVAAGDHKTFTLCQDTTGGRTFPTAITGVHGLFNISANGPPLPSTCAVQTYKSVNNNGTLGWYADTAGVINE